MKITALHVYPVKGLRGIPLTTARLGPHGIRHDRTFMILQVHPGGDLKKVQLASHPCCALFSQELASDDNPENAESQGPSHVVVRYHTPAEALAPPHPLQSAPLRVPLEPSTDNLEKLVITMYNSSATAYRMGDEFDAWFTACLGFPALMAYIGDGRRPVLGTVAPQQPATKGWVSTFGSYIARQAQSSSPQPATLTFTDVSPFLVTSEASLADVSSRLPAGDDDIPMYKFRPNIVVTGSDPYDEDYWAEISFPRRGRGLLLTANCARCTSLNVDYDTGRTAIGPKGTVLKLLSSDRRVDAGAKWSPIFGRYGFLADGQELTVSVGDEVEVAKRNTERSVWDWPVKMTGPNGTYIKTPAPQQDT